MSAYWMLDQATQADYAEPIEPADDQPPPSCPTCDAHRRHVCRLAKSYRKGRLVRVRVEGFRCPDCGGHVYDDGYSTCVCDGVDAHWEG